MPDIPGNTSTTVSITVDGPPVSDVLEVVNDHDWVRITLTAGQKIVINVDGLTLEDSFVTMRDASGNQLAFNDDISSGVVRDSRLVFTAPTSGTYYIDVSSFNQEYAGTYQLSVQTWTPPPVADIATIATHLTHGYWGGDSHAFAATQGGSISVNLTALTAAGQTLAREALLLWSDIIGITFNEVASGGQITFDDNESGAFSTSIRSGGITSSAHVNVSTQWLTTYGSTIGSYSFQTYIHEIGHALGLGHSGFYNGDATFENDALFANDGWPATVMSYFDQDESIYFNNLNFTNGYVVTPMLADIRGMATLYGLSTTTRLGDTTYGFGNNSGRSVYTASVGGTITALTIVDSGGVDTLNYSGFSSNQLINLNAETYSNIGGGTGNVTIGFGTVIENAIGGNGIDTIIGNSANNVISGGAGADSLTGGGGGDTFLDTTAAFAFDIITDFNIGDKLIFTNASLGSFTFSLSGSTLTYTGGSLTLTGGVSGTLVSSAAAGGGVQLTIQTVVAPIDGTVGDDTLNGTTGNDTINGLDGNDTLGGLAGNDLINGGTGSDTLTGGSGIDSLTGGTGNDIFRDTAAGLNGDTITDFVVGDAIVISDAALAGFAFSLSGNTLTYTGGSLILTGGVSGTLVSSAAAGGGVQLTIQTVVAPIDGTVGDDTLNGTTGNDTINGLDGNDTLGGLAGNDLINGGTGSDTLTGGSGIDSLTGGTGNDIFRDTAAGLNGDTITDFVVGDAIVISDAALAGFAFSLSGSTLTYTGGSLILTGGVSGTLVSSAAAGGGVQLTIQTVVAPIDGTVGDDTLNGTTGNDTINGLDGNDTLGGLAGNDLINGGTGSDTLTGGSGIDSLTGGTGNDIFRDTAAGLNGDTITDFVVGDAIVISDAALAGFTFSLSGNTLTYSGGSLVLTGGVSGTLVSSAAASGGVQLTIQTVPSAINGTAGNDVLTGTSAGDTINGLGGNDILTGGAGADSLTGGTGNDTFRDTAAGLNGDTITDFVVGDRILITNTSLTGFTFSLSGNTLTYTGGSLTLTGVSGTLVASAVGGGGFPGANGGVQLTIQTVVAPIDGTVGDDTLNGTTGNDTINGLDGNDTLGGLAGNDLINGGTGSDTLTGGSGIDSLTGGTGNDIFRDTAAGLNGDTITDFVVGDAIVISDAALAGFTFSLSGNTLTYTGGSLTLTGGVSGTLVSSAAAGGGVQLTIQTVVAPIDGTVGDDTLNGTTGNDTINGLDGNDTLGGLAGNDLINGGTGSDTLTGGSGIDSLTGGTGNDIFRDTAAGLNGDTITDFVVGDAIVISDAALAGFTFSLSGNTLTYTGGSLTLTGGVSGTLVSSAAAGGGVQLTIQTVVAPIDGTVGDDTLNGTTGNDTINGLDGNDTLGGLAGNDLINGGTGSDTLTGGSGIDSLTGGTGNDIFRDTAAGLNGDTITDFVVGDAIVISDAALAGFTFSLSGNTLTYTGGSLTLTGGVSGTLVSSAAAGGGVQLTIQTVVAPIDGTVGDDTLNGTTGNDTINGLDGNDTLGGLAGNDLINGGTGSDTLTGGSGIDSLTGGTGNDIFRDTAAGLNGDTITDFVVGDAIVISDAALAGFTFSLSGNTLTYTGGSLILTGGVSGTLVSSAAAGGGVQLTIQTVPSAINGTAGNDVLTGTSAGDTINGLGGNDILTGGAGADSLTGGTGNDTFRDTAAGLNGDTITDFVVGDRILITNTSLTGFTFSLSGNTLTYTGGSLTLTGVSGTLVASAVGNGVPGASGGVQLTIQTATAAMERIAADEDSTGIAGADVTQGHPGDDSFLYARLANTHVVGEGTSGIIGDQEPASISTFDRPLDTMIGQGNFTFDALWTPNSSTPNTSFEAVPISSWIEPDMSGFGVADLGSLGMDAGRYHIASGDFYL